MKTLKLDIDLTVEEAAGLYEFLDKLSNAIWTTYGTEIEQLFQEHQNYSKVVEEDEEDEVPDEWFDDEIPF